MDGRPWLLGYLARIYRGNVLSSTKAKRRAFINDSVDAYGTIHLCDYRKQEQYWIKKEISRQIFTPGSGLDPPNNAPNMANHPSAIDLVNFHCRGFCLIANQVLNHYYINYNQGNFNNYILHFGFCLQRQELLELRMGNEEWGTSYSQNRTKETIATTILQTAAKKIGMYWQKGSLFHFEGASSGHSFWSNKSQPRLSIPCKGPWISTTIQWLLT